MAKHQENLPELLGWLALAWGAGFAVAVVWFVNWRRRAWLPALRQSYVPWTGWEIFLVFIWVYPVVQSIVHSIAPAIGSPEASQHLWQAILLPAEIGFILVLLRLSSDTRPYQLGLHTNRLGANLILGYLGWFFLAMPVIFLNYQVKGLHSLWKSREPEVHQLFTLFDLQPDLATWGLITFTAVVAAPLREEFLFRGLLQPWLVRRPEGSYFVLCWAVFLAFVIGWSRFKGPLPPFEDSIWFREVIDRVSPLLFVAVMIPGYFVCHHLFRPIIADRAAAQAIYASSLFFGAVHSGAWPDPVALFVLALGLGYLAYRTRSLVGSIMAHSMFNAIACLALLVNLLWLANKR